MSPAGDRDDESHLDIETRVRMVEKAVVAMNDIAADLAVAHSRLPQAIATAMQQAIDGTLSNDDKMNALFTRLTRHLTNRAKNEAGGLVFGFVIKGLGWLLAFLVLASYLGWVPAFKVMAAAKP